MTAKLLPLCVLAFAALSVQASDQQREQDYAAMLGNASLAGESVWLKSADKQFLGLFMEAEKTDNRQAALILHDQGGHPDQQPLVHQLRSTLPLHNWSTLSLQMPLHEIGAPVVDYYLLFDQARERIDAGIAYLQQRGAKQIAIVGYGMGAAMASYSLQSQKNRAIALVVISLPLPETSIPQAQTGDFLKAINLPILDLYAEFDLPDVASTARQRRMIAKANPVFRQLRIDGENHAYLNDPGLLVKRVYSWLALTAGEK